MKEIKTGFPKTFTTLVAIGRYMYIDDKGRSKPIPPSELKKWKEKQKEGS